MLLDNKTIVERKVGVAVIRNKEGKILIDKRLSTDSLGGFWEFPGGKIENGETVVDCIKREVKEELDIDIKVGEHLITINHIYSEDKIVLIVHVCEILQGEPKTIECQEIRWVNMSDLSSFQFPEANINIINALINRFVY